MDHYVKSTNLTLRILKALPNYASKRAEMDIRKLDVTTSSAINPLKTMKACIAVLESCVSALEMDKEAQQKQMEKMTIIDKFFDWCNDIVTGGAAGLKVLMGADAEEVAKEMANITRTGKGKVTFVRYVSAFKKPGKNIEDRKRLLDNMPKLAWTNIEETKKVLDEMLDDNVKFNNLVERCGYYIDKTQELINLIQKEIE